MVARLSGVGGTAAWTGTRRRGRHHESIFIEHRAGAESRPLVAAYRRSAGAETGARSEGRGADADRGAADHGEIAAGIRGVEGRVGFCLLAGQPAARGRSRLHALDGTPLPQVGAEYRG